jgi:hypothetical protein
MPLGVRRVGAAARLPTTVMKGSCTGSSDSRPGGGPAGVVDEAAPPAYGRTALRTDLWRIDNRCGRRGAGQGRAHSTYRRPSSPDPDRGSPTEDRMLRAARRACARRLLRARGVCRARR